jgi:hypothetical protein
VLDKWWQFRRTGAEISDSVAAKPKWPGDGLQQIRIVRDVLAKAVAAAGSDDISRIFDGKNSSVRKQRVEQVLETLVATSATRAMEPAVENAALRYFAVR